MRRGALILLAAGAYYYVEKVNTKMLPGNNGVMPCSAFCSMAGWASNQLPPSWKGAKAVRQLANGADQPVTNAPGNIPALKTLLCGCRRSDSTPYLTGNQIWSPWGPGRACPPSVCATGDWSTNPATPLAPAS